MPRVVAVDVVVEAEIAVVFAHVPVARRRTAVHQCAIVHHREIEAAAVPGDELRGVLLDAVEEAPDELGFAVLGPAQRPDAESLALAQRAGDRQRRDAGAAAENRRRSPLARARTRTPPRPCPSSEPSRPCKRLQSRGCRERSRCQKPASGVNRIQAGNTPVDR